MKIKAVIFDFDGVIVNSEPLYEETGKTLLRHYGVTPTAKDWQVFKGLTAQDFFKKAKERFNIPDSLSTIAQRDHDILKRKFKTNLQYINGFHQFYQFVVKNYQTGLVTSTARELLNWIYDNTLITPQFDTVITADDVDSPKPHPEPYRLIAKKLQICPNEMVVIEDSVNGVISAKRAGSNVIGFLTSFKQETLKEAHCFASDYIEARRCLESLAKGN